MQTNHATSSVRRFLPAAALAVALSFAPTAARAQAAVAPTVLDNYLITATRTPVEPLALGTAVDRISAADLAKRQIASLGGALGLAGGVPMMATGAPGGSTALFLRGANSNQTLFLVDGIRLNDPNTDYQLFLGGACVAACDSLEISRGPQSTLYGGEAVGGVIALRAMAGDGPPRGHVAVEAGSFGTVHGAVHTQGARDDWSYAFSLAGGHTDNARPNNFFDSANLVARVDRRVNDTVTLGATARGFAGNYGSPGSRFTNDPDNRERERNGLGTVFATFHPHADLAARVTVGGQLRRFESINPSPNGTVQITEVTNRRGVLDAQATYAGWSTHRVTGGLTAEANATRNTGFGDIDENQRLFAVFLQDEWSPLDTLHFTAGLRSDDHDTFGRATTGRASVAWQVLPERVKARASHATAFRAPSFLDLYGRSAFYAGNPDLDPEKARGWDAGMDFYLPEGRGALGITWFDTRITNLIVFNFGVFPGTTANVERARTRGLEVAGRLAWTSRTELRLAYTHLEAENLTTGARLLRRPRHAGTADLWHDFGAGFSGGLGLQWVVDRQDVHAQNFATIDARDYVVARVYAAWAVNDRVTLKGRVENLGDKFYEPVHGYPQPGLGGYLGLEWHF
jgi:vitamin B12 transporter